MNGRITLFGVDSFGCTKIFGDRTNAQQVSSLCIIREHVREMQVLQVFGLCAVLSHEILSMHTMPTVKWNAGSKEKRYATNPIHIQFLRPTRKRRITNFVNEK